MGHLFTSGRPWRRCILENPCAGSNVNESAAISLRQDRTGSGVVTESPRAKARPRPFVKWAGGKQGAIPDLASAGLLPAPKTIASYVEPFTGGGAMFYHLLPKRAVLNDLNRHLIVAYSAVREAPEALIERLRWYAAEHNSRNEDGQREFFERIRSLYGAMTSIDRAARFIYLNRTCFNGLYRENSLGRFNVPFAASKKPLKFDELNILAASATLRNAVLSNESAFSKTVTELIGRGTFVYLDPPYEPITDTSFTSYTSEDFSWADQQKLADLAQTWSHRGAFVLVSNSNHPKLQKLYEQRGFHLTSISVPRAISSKGSTRGAVPEFVFHNYAPGSLSKPIVAENEHLR